MVWRTIWHTFGRLSSKWRVLWNFPDQTAWKVSWNGWTWFDSTVAYLTHIIIQKTSPEATSWPTLIRCVTRKRAVCAHFLKSILRELFEIIKAPFRSRKIRSLLSPLISLRIRRPVYRFVLRSRSDAVASTYFRNMLGNMPTSFRSHWLLSISLVSYTYMNLYKLCDYCAKHRQVFW